MPSTIQTRLTTLFQGALRDLGYDPDGAKVVPCGNPKHGDYQFNGAMAAAVLNKENPRHVAERIVTLVNDDPIIGSLEIAGPGFINIHLSDGALVEAVGQRLARTHEPDFVFIDYGGPNIAKAMHVGHLRSSVIGDSLKRILAFRGHTVKGDVHLGDWGLPMGLLAAELRLQTPGLPYFSNETGPYPEGSPVTIDDLEVMYPRASARSKEEPEFLSEARSLTALMQAGHPGLRSLLDHFRKVSIERLEKDFLSIGVEFDLWDGESTVADIIPPLCDLFEAEGVAKIDDGALVIDVCQPDDAKEMPPFILRKSDGAALYSTTDLATVDHRHRAGADRIVYVVDARQALHFEQLFRAVKKSGRYDGLRLDHAGFGTVNGKDGKPFKTRDGGVMRLGDLVDMAVEKARMRLEEGSIGGDLTKEELDELASQIGIGAIKYADLSSNRETSYTFDLDRVVSFEGRTGPYIQYMAVRMQSILTKAAGMNLDPPVIGPPSNTAERALMLSLTRFGDAVMRAEKLLAPSEISQWLWETANAVSQFYATSPVLSEPDTDLAARRLGLVVVSRKFLTLGLGLLGISAPARM